MAHVRNAIEPLLWKVMSIDHSPGKPEPARSFGGVADAYDRGRPTYPREAAVWLTSDRPLSVLELGAGTGKLTQQLVALGHDVHATEPDPKMLAILARNLPDVRASQATAEEIPSGDSSYDVVVSAQAFHWFDYDKALPEIARVLRPRGRLSLVWNQRDERIPWVKRLGKIIGTQEHLTDPAEVLGEVEAVRRGRGGGVPVLADRGPALDPRPGPLPLQHRAPLAARAGGQDGGGARVLRGVRPGQGRHAAALHGHLLPLPDARPGGTDA